ncbi:MAG: 2-dehydropantoate 2-reductase [Gemmataceae bacterium]|nr:2-dehydropantoate 2-reductase [Gemmataceae bacterium]MCI0743744.1 2-dehydropantoate 2-reductase [Gemmataceae bacterium]
MQEQEWPRIAVVGAGAVGCYFGGMLARAGAPVTLIGRAQHVEAINRAGLFLDGLHIQERIAVSASTELAAAREAKVVLLSVKTLDTEETAKALAAQLSPEAALLSLQNGVDNVARIRKAAGIDAIPAVVYVAAAMTAPGHVKHTGRGDLIVGYLPVGNSSTLLAPIRDAKKLDGLRDMFTRAEIPCVVSDNIEADLWSKMIMNCAFNAISALARAKYVRIVRHPESRVIMIKAVEEAVAVARAAGVRFGDVDHVDAAVKLGEAMAGATSSTAQDIARGKRTEIDSLNGYVVCLGAERGLATPVNQTLYALVKLLEETA